MVFQCLIENKLNEKLSKCSFFQKEIQYLGHIVSGDKITTNPRKVEDIFSWLYLWGWQFTIEGS